MPKFPRHPNVTDQTDHAEDTLVVRAPTIARGEACLVVVAGAEMARRYNIGRKTMRIGRASDCDVRLEVPGVSRYHSVVRNTSEGPVVEDLGSTNGTRVNGELVKMRLLEDGDRIILGRAVLKLIFSDNLEDAYYDEMYRLTTTDDLTGVFNRRHFLATSSRELARARRHSRPFSLLLLDVDHFKAVNDQHGHLTGDRVLREIAYRCQSGVGPGDIVGRYGGEEFGIVLPETPLAEAYRVAERLRSEMADRPIQVNDQYLVTTVSIGVADYAGVARDRADLRRESAPPQLVCEALIQVADERLYRAKDQGRNRVVGA